mmetsp:Transcript_34003/g.43711  ORF Transcript_34003/g.43711 Transcript_34003/m.43711 type:complete len:313 (-) Transcript_34003:126-1064(-)|eukprot:CAMPEP_0117741358 /NCGR_PEP_ID=MMETSP0947-20121206/4868_1 /TAXON_ID=44440 /ORGANISM="Chattonella subsalsa, Strain CCMP2191" /LENGTH=312 /DNA_ID=CAMNT_0005557605 /DNA_START=1148 /DNA_END=2086 /DNA_ORIENTATION=-
MINEGGSLYKMLSNLFDEDACGKTRFHCYHVLFLLKVPKPRTNELNEKISYLEDVISWKAKRNACIWHHSFTIFEYDKSDASREAYFSLKYMLYESNSLGYSFIFFMEPSLHPIVPGWLESVYEMTFDFWEREPRAIVKGSPVKSGLRRSAAYGHLNRNCIWKVGNIHVLNKVILNMDKFIHLTAFLDTTYEVLFRHIFLLPRNERLLNVTLSQIDEGASRWISALNFVYSTLGNEPFNQTLRMTPEHQFLAIGTHPAKTFCDDPCDSSREVLLKENPNYLFAVCSPADSGKVKHISNGNNNQSFRRIHETS